MAKTALAAIAASAAEPPRSNIAKPADDARWSIVVTIPLVACFVTNGATTVISSDQGVAVGPVAVADETLVELAGGMTRQLGIEVHGLRTLVVRQPLPAVGD